MRVALERKRPGSVYFIWNGSAIKIGYSLWPEIRVDDLQTSNSEQLYLLASFRGTQDDERNLHFKFKHLRVRGEWFRPDMGLVAFIKAIPDCDVDILPTKYFPQEPPPTGSADEILGLSVEQMHSIRAKFVTVMTRAKDDAHLRARLSILAYNLSDLLRDLTNVVLSHQFKRNCEDFHEWYATRGA